MDRDAVRSFCLSFPGTTEQLQWGADLLYKIGGKMFVVTNMGPDPVSLSLKADPEKFDELCGRTGVRPAPYLARAKWVRIDAENDLTWGELQALITESYALVNAKLPKSKRGGATATKKTPKKAAKKKVAVKRSTARAKSKPKPKTKGRRASKAQR